MASGDLLVCYIGIYEDKPFILREVRSTKGVLVRLVNKYNRYVVIFQASASRLVPL